MALGIVTRSLLTVVLMAGCIVARLSFADSVNSPNITMNVDTNRSAGNGAGNVAVAVNTVTIAEVTTTEYSSGTGKAITIKARPGFQFDSTSNVTAQSTTIGLNGGALNAIATLTPTGTANESLTFNFTSGTNASAQDVIRINGLKIKILSAAGAAGPAQTTMTLSTSSVGGAFNNQGIAAASITKGAADRLVFASQPANSVAAGDILPAVKIVDFGGNLISNDPRTITLALQTNPGSATLLGTAQHDSTNGVASWTADDDLRITTASSGYTLQATHSGASFLTSDAVASSAFDITAGNPGSMEFSVQPPTTDAGADLIVSVTLKDEFGNSSTTSGVNITLDSAVNPGGWPLLVDTSLTKATVNGVASWEASDNLRITKAITGYKLSASGLGSPITTNAFDIIPAAPILLRYVQGPSGARENTAIDPPLTVEVTDLFGNRTESTLAITLTPNDSSCTDGMVSNQAAAVNGLATFTNFALGEPCEDLSLLATGTGFVGASSDEFTVSAENAFAIALSTARFKRNKFIQFSASGDFNVSTEAIDDPTKNGARLFAKGTTGTATISLPKKRWSKVGTTGFRFSSARCPSVVVTDKSISVKCAGRTGNLKVPEEELYLALFLGKGNAQFCGTCGGTSAGNALRQFRRNNCAAPSACAQ